MPTSWRIPRSLHEFLDQPTILAWCLASLFLESLAFAIVHPLGKRVATGAFLAAIFGINTELSMVYQVFSLLVSLLFFSMIATYFTRATLEGYRNLPTQVMVNKPFEYELCLRNPSGKLQKGIVLFETFPDPRPHFAPFMKARLEPEELRRNAYDQWVGLYD